MERISGTKPKPETLKMNYNNNSSELCELGKKYDTDKSSQRSNVTNNRHCHPYTLFYDSIFKNKKLKNSRTMYIRWCFITYVERILYKFGNIRI